MNAVFNSILLAWRLRRAWWFTATARTKARFARTALGSFWLGLSNLLSIAVLAVVYGTVFKVQDFNHYIVFLGTGLVTWNAIAAAVSSAPSLFEYNSGHLRNTNLHPIYYTLEEWSFQVQTFLQSFALVLLVLSVLQPYLYPRLLTVGLLPLVNLILFVYWFPLLLCLLAASYHDLFQLVPIAVQLIFLLSPILYEKSSLGRLSWIADVNPFYRVLSPLRHALLQGELKVVQSLVLLVVNILGVYGAIWLLEKRRPALPFLV
jgi:lipopolysaccharide transport system permease protein